MATTGTSGTTAPTSSASSIDKWKSLIETAQKVYDQLNRHGGRFAIWLKLFVVRYWHPFWYAFIFWGVTALTIVWAGAWTYLAITDVYLPRAYVIIGYVPLLLWLMFADTLVTITILVCFLLIETPLEFIRNNPNLMNFLKGRDHARDWFNRYKVIVMALAILLFLMPKAYMIGFGIVAGALLFFSAFVLRPAVEEKALASNKEEKNKIGQELGESARVTGKLLRLGAVAVFAAAVLFAGYDSYRIEFRPDAAEWANGRENAIVVLTEEGGAPEVLTVADVERVLSAKASDAYGDYVRTRAELYGVLQASYEFVGLRCVKQEHASTSVQGPTAVYDERCYRAALAVLGKADVPEAGQALQELMGSQWSWDDERRTLKDAELAVFEPDSQKRNLVHARLRLMTDPKCANGPWSKHCLQYVAKTAVVAKFLGADRSIFTKECRRQRCDRLSFRVMNLQTGKEIAEPREYLVSATEPTSLPRAAEDFVSQTREAVFAARIPTCMEYQLLAYGPGDPRQCIDQGGAAELAGLKEIFKNDPYRKAMRAKLQEYLDPDPPFYRRWWKAIVREVDDSAWDIRNYALVGVCLGVMIAVLYIAYLLYKWAATFKPAAPAPAKK